MDMDTSALSGMTLNERLCRLGLVDDYDRAVRADDMQGLFNILAKTEIGEENIYPALIAVSKRLNKDIRLMLEERFCAGDIKDAEEFIRPYTGKTSMRVLKCAVYASKGSLEKLLEMLYLAERDWRDVIMFGEYEVFVVDQKRKLAKIRDFS